MNELITNAMQLPDTIEDLSKFVLIGREKLNSVRAEIRAIDKVHLAEEVRNQKKDEARMLSEALLDAEVRLGELLKQLPKATKGNQYTGKMVTDTTVHNQKPKSEVIKNLGFSEKQAQRFETLADNKDLVEHVKQEARENDDLPTRSRVIDLAQQRKKKEAEEQAKNDDFNSYIDECGVIWKKFHRAITSFIEVEVDQSTLKKWKAAIELGNTQEEVQKYLNYVAEDISKLLTIQKFLKGMKK